MDERQKKLLALLEDKGPKLYALMLRLTLRRDVAEDLMQELFLKLSNSNGLDRANQPAAYAYRSAINLAFDWRRKNKRAPLPLDDSDRLIRKSSTPLNKMVEAEQRLEVLNAMEKLNGLTRQVCIMRYIQQESNETIAEHVGKTPHQVRALCAKALTQLRELLIEDKANYSR